MLKEDKKLAAILLLALLLRLSVFYLAVENRQLHEPDSYSYQAMAKAVASGDFLFNGNSSVFEVSKIRTPGYPAFLGVFYFLGLEDNAAAFVQLLLDTAGVFLIFLTCQYVFKSTDAGLAAAALYAISPLPLSLSFKILTEGLTIFLFLLANLFFWRSFPGKDRRDIFYTALMLGVMALVRPILLPVALLYAAVLYICSKDLDGCMLLILVPVFFTFLWVARNAIVFGEALVSSITAVTYTCWNAVFLANDPAIDKQAWSGLIREYGLTSIEECQRTNTVDKMDAGFGRIAGFILSNPFTYSKYVALGGAFFFSPVLPNYMLGVLGQGGQEIHMTGIIAKRGFDVQYMLGKIRERPAYAALFLFSFLYYFVVYLFAIYGGCKVFAKDTGKMFAVLLALLLLYNIITLGPVANYRYRMPVEPFILMLAGFGIYMFFTKPASSGGKALSPSRAGELASSLRGVLSRKSELLQSSGCSFAPQ